MKHGSVVLPCGHRIHVQIATSPAELRDGLQGQSPARDEGMLFVFPKTQAVTFWMRGVSGPLDIVWLTRDARIAHILHQARPCANLPCRQYRFSAQYVLELQGGQAKAHGLRPGQVIRL